MINSLKCDLYFGPWKRPEYKKISISLTNYPDRVFFYLFLNSKNGITKWSANLGSYCPYDLRKDFVNKKIYSLSGTSMELKNIIENLMSSNGYIKLEDRLANLL